MKKVIQLSTPWAKNSSPQTWSYLWNGVLIWAALMLALTGLSAAAQSVPQLINYQGQLLDASGAPMPTGDYSIEVRLFPVESGGVANWGPQVFNGQSGVGFGPKVAVVNGRFNLVLGPQDIATNSLTGVFAANASVFVELKVGTSSPISPRQQVLSAPFALSAANAVNAVNAATATNAANAANAQNAVNAVNAVNAQNATTATTATTAVNANNAANASNSARLNGFDWSSIFSGGNPQFGALSVASATVRGDTQIGTSSSDYRKLIMGGGNSFGYIYGSFPGLGDGIHMGYNYYNDASGTGHAFATDGPTSRFTVGYGLARIATGNINQAPISRLRVTTTTVFVENATFSNGSDRNAKQDFAPVSPSQILEKVLQLPISEWSYKADPETRHVGPMAQDFFSAFNIGTDDKHISPIDEGGVALAAIQALNRKVEEKETQIEQLQKRLEKLEQLLKSAGER
jgi:hypothetical protein